MKIIKSKPYFLQRNTIIATIIGYLLGTRHFAHVFQSLTIAPWGRLLSSLCWWVIGSLEKLGQGSQDSNWPGWLPSPHAHLCPQWPVIHDVCTRLTSQSRSELSRELDVGVTWLWLHHIVDCQDPLDWCGGRVSSFSLTSLCIRLYVASSDNRNALPW